MLKRIPDPSTVKPPDLTTASPGPSAAVPLIQRVEAHLARRFHQVCLGKLAEVTGSEDLSPLEYGILGSLDDAPGIDQRRLAERMGIDTVSAHKIIGRLEGLGLVDRQVGVDRPTVARAAPHLKRASPARQFAPVGPCCLGRDHRLPVGRRAADAARTVDPNHRGERNLRPPGERTPPTPANQGCAK